MKITREDAVSLAQEAAYKDCNNFFHTFAQLAIDKALAAQPATVPEDLTDKQVVSACYSYRHDFGLLDKDAQERIAFQCREWWRAMTKELSVPSQHPFVLATAAGEPLPLAAAPKPDQQETSELTDEELIELWRSTRGWRTAEEFAIPYTRAAIAAHEAKRGVK